MFRQISILLTLLLALVAIVKSADLHKRSSKRSSKYPQLAKAVISTPGIHATFWFQLRVDIPKPKPGNARPIPGLENHPTMSTRVWIQYSGVPAGQELAYHIHNKPVTNNDCTSAGDHWNPTQSSMNNPKSPCDRNKLGHCESGDLSGKHGKLKKIPDGQLVTYYDSSLRLSHSSRGILGKSVVIHNPAGDRIGCATIKALS
ncbi:hypothetical protein PGT21_004113 [Puccinia graminis f. sp. tritici]|uniref:Superoxide dismutase copper/zinc binding domain-containing protein n=1 Tax=Puccinia graminis f. sp. tritici TaxID=56615 RepID=A0A5B0NNX0_PUCGR|nr:hypothetical protein PGTUg99_032308 [Puccinia graminis f. sp. tritici]KAA1090523.1 hypothetical protein PGT21_004113 [Puccinia graminis f. sp. tritici]